MKIRSGHLLILVIVYLGYVVFEDHYTDAKNLIKQALTPATTRQNRQVQPLYPSPRSFYPDTTHSPSARYESDCWWGHAEVQTAQAETLDPSRFRAVTEAESGIPRLLELPVYREDVFTSTTEGEDVFAPKATMSTEFSDANGNRWQLVSGFSALQKGEPLTGDIIRKDGRVYFVQMNQARTACHGKWVLVGRK